MTPAIVVSAYNRPEALARLLASLRKAAYPADARQPLVISIDRGDHPGNTPTVDIDDNIVRAITGGRGGNGGTSPTTSIGGTGGNAGDAVAMAVGTVAISVWNDLLRAITRAIGAWTPSSTIFFMGELFLVTICLHYAVRLSSLGRQVKNLAQEVAMLREESGRHPRTPD